MPLETIRCISLRYSPPGETLRDGRIADDYGSEKHASLIVNHHCIDDVQAAELEFYHDVWVFLGAKDLLFYMHPVLTGFLYNRECQFIDRYLYALDQKWDEVVRSIGDLDSGRILTEMHEIKSEFPHDADWESLVNI